MDPNPSINGLDAFLKSLDRTFFATSTVQCFTPHSDQALLVLNLQCSLDFVEILYHRSQGNWGDQQNEQLLPDLLAELQSNSGNLVDIEELCLEFNDALIVIRRTGPKSIVAAFAEIMETLAAHYVHLTKELQEVPYEVYMPVTETDPAAFLPEASATDEYFRYWALYYESDSNPLIYDLQARKLIQGELWISNPEK